MGGMVRLIRRIGRALGFCVALLAIAAGAYVGAAWGFGRLAVHADAGPPPPGTGIEIGLSSNGAHTNLHLPVLNPVVDWFAVFPPTDAPAPPPLVGTVSIGWGHRDFYLTTPTWDDFRLSTGVRAVLGIGPSALHVGYWPPGWRAVEHRTFRVSEAAFRTLVDYVLAAAEVDPAGTAPARLIPGHSYSGCSGRYPHRPLGGDARPPALPRRTPGRDLLSVGSEADEGLHMKGRLVRPVDEIAADRTGAARQTAPVAAVGAGRGHDMVAAVIDGIVDRAVCAAGEGADRAGGQTRLVGAAVARARPAKRDRPVDGAGEQQGAAIGVP